MSAALLQDFTTYAGDSVSPIYTVTNAAGTALDISTASAITWKAKRNSASAAVITKTLGTQIVLVGGGTAGQYQVNLLSADTAPLSGYYVYSTAITDSLGNVTTVATGRMRVGVEPIWSFDPTQLATSPLYQVRSMIGDVVETQQQLTDGEVLYAISMRTTSYGAAAECCRNLSVRYARSVDQSAGSQKISYSQMSKAYALQALAFETKATMSGSGTPFSGGISQADKLNNVGDDDNVEPSFGIGMFDNDIPLGQTSPVSGAPVSDESR